MTGQPKKIRLGDLLVEHKLISEAQLSAALAEQKTSGHKLGRVLIENGYVKEDDVLDLLSRQLNVPFVDLSTYQFKADVVKKLPETAARRFRAIALEEQPDGLLVGMADPTNIFAYDDLVRVIKSPIKIAVVKEGDWLRRSTVFINTVQRFRTSLPRSVRTWKKMSSTWVR